MILFDIIPITLSLVYSVLILWIYRGWKAAQSKDIPSITKTNIGASIIIPIRNEAAHLQTCIQSILDNDRPHEQYEILIIDDHSTDNTSTILSNFTENNIRYLPLPDPLSGKKQGIIFGIEHAKFPVIICTDGDSIVGKDWILTHLAQYHDPLTQITTGTVLPLTNHTLLSQFQWLDFVSMMAVTTNGIYRKSYFLGNAANLSYLKSAFITHDGFEGNLDRASGDDIYLIQKMANTNADSVAFNNSRNAIVFTKSEVTWHDFFTQRKRWASKAMSGFDSHVKWVQGFIFAYTLIMVLWLPITIFYPSVFTLGCFILWVVKIIVDFLFLGRLAYYFKNLNALRWFIPSFFIYILHILLSGYYALFPPTYIWKDRSLK